MPPDPGPLFAWAPTQSDPMPTQYAPTPARFKRPAGPRDFRAEWAALRAARPDVWAWLVERCRDELSLGVKRISTNALFEIARTRFGVSLNHDWRAACSDDLIAQDPRLATLIERRARKVTK